MAALQGKKVVITGAAGALGRAVTEVARKQGATAVLVDLMFPEGFEPEAEKHTVNLCDRDATLSTFAAIGPVDAVINLAGGFDMGPTCDQTSDEQWQGMFSMNVDTVRNVIAAVIPSMTERKTGAMVNVGAFGALQGLPNMSAYTSSKSVVMRLTESLSAEVRAQGVNVNAVLPTVIDTPRNRADMPDADFSEWVDPVDLGNVICFLASDAARAVHGALVPVKGLS